MSGISDIFGLLSERGIRTARGLPLDKYSSFKIGGEARLAAFPKDENELSAVVCAAADYDIKYVVIGNGTNVLFPDEGYDGLVIFTSGMSEFSVSDNGNVTDDGNVCAGAGVSLTSLASEAQKAGLSGLEFAYGIPGSVGGAVYMNAGAYGGQMADVVTAVSYFNAESGKTETISASDLKFEYRKSVFTGSTGKIIVRVKMSLSHKDPDEILALMKKNMQARIDKQPLNYPSAGSVFKRYPGFYTAKLIEEAGLKGARVGKAAVSEKHAGFIINLGGASAADVKALIEMIKARIYEKNGIRIECEIRFI